MPLVPHTPATEEPDHAAMIVALDAGDLAGAELDRAETLARSCAGCTALASDLAAIRGAMIALPVPPRLRDYRLTEADAARLQPGGWRRLIGWLAAPRSSVRPFATGLATLGIVGLLVSAGLPSLGSGSARVPESVGSSVPNPLPAETTSGSGGSEFLAPYAPAAAPTAAPAAVPSAAPSAGGLPPASAGPGSGEAGVTGQDTSPTATSDRNLAAAPTDGALPADKSAAPTPGATTGLSPLVLVSAGLLAAGLLLLLGRAIAIRRGA
jgi:hypothetical protein